MIRRTPGTCCQLPKSYAPAHTRRRIAGSNGRCGEIESIEVHDLVPRGDEVAHELLLRVSRRIHLRDCAELRVRTEDQVDGRGRPLNRPRAAVAALVRVVPCGWLPLRAHVEQVDEEVVGQRLRLLRKNAVSRLA